MSPRLLLGALIASASLACYSVAPPPRPELSSFAVQINGVYANPGRTQVPVVTPCASRFGGQSAVPADQRGTTSCPYVMPRGEIEIDLTATALDAAGAALTSFAGPVSFRVVPGDLTGDYPNRWALSQAGIATGTVKVAHVFGEVRVWAEDAPPQLIFADGGVGGSIAALPQEPVQRTYATGLSLPVVFEDPTIAKVQIPDGFDNRSSPLVGQFLTVGKNSEDGTQLLRHSCANDSERDGQPAFMVVTGTDPQGFFVTDLNSCRLKEDTVDPSTGSTAVRVPEPSGFLPGTYGSMFVYNYSFPEGLDQGDLLFTLSGAVQEFASTTQLVFPAWSIAEKVRTLEESQWDKHLKLVPIVDLNLRMCGLDQSPFVTDALCGHNRRNLKLESLESSLVRARGLKMPQEFDDCDLDGNDEVPFFCETIIPSDPPVACQSNTDCPTSSCDRTLGVCGGWGWSDCAFGSGPPEPQISIDERGCNIACVTSKGEHAGRRCSERATFRTYGQFVAEMPGPGPQEAGLDPSLPDRLEPIAITATSTLSLPHVAGDELLLFCTAPVRWKAGDASVVATSADALLPAGTLARHMLTGAETNLAVIAEGTPGAGASCTLSVDTRTRLNIVTKDAIPELNPDCDEADADPVAAEQCRFFRGATYDVVGHLRHLQPGRPRWVILPRDPDDVCCHPGPGLACPKPIKPCQ